MIYTRRFPKTWLVVGQSFGLDIMALLDLFYLCSGDCTDDFDRYITEV